jgi:hypothetical protein
MMMMMVSAGMWVVHWRRLVLIITTCCGQIVIIIITMIMIMIIMACLHGHGTLIQVVPFLAFMTGKCRFPMILIMTTTPQQDPIPLVSGLPSAP